MTPTLDTQPDLISLGDNFFALRYPYAVVVAHHIERRIPLSFRRDIETAGLEIGFAVETIETAGTQRADAPEMRKAMPAEVALLESLLTETDLRLKDFILLHCRKKKG